MNEKEMSAVKKRAQEETRYKVEAMTKLESLRLELQTMQGSDAPAQSVSFWREQCQGLFDICRNLREDNEKLVAHLGAAPPSYPAGTAGTPGEAEGHPLDQFQNNADLLNYLNNTGLK